MSVSGRKNMPQTDRQTDKATWWSLTIYDEKEIAKVEDSDNYPRFVKSISGGMEKCPTTGRLHFQGALQCRSQQRFSAIKDWLQQLILSQRVNLR